MVKGWKVIDKIGSDNFTNFKHKTFQYFFREKLILILLNYLKCFHKGQDSCLEFQFSHVKFWMHFLLFVFSYI